MQFQSRIIRTIFLNMFVGFTPEALFSLIAAWYINEGYIWAVFIYFGLQALYFAVWIVRSIFEWAYFFILGRKKLATILCDNLHLNKFPMPGDYERSAEDYLSSVIKNEDVSIQARISAAQELGSMKMAQSLGQIQYLGRITISYEDAIDEYKRNLIRSQK